MPIAGSAAAGGGALAEAIDLTEVARRLLRCLTDNLLATYRSVTKDTRRAQGWAAVEGIDSGVVRRAEHSAGP